MHKLIDEIKKHEGNVKIVKNFIDQNQINDFLNLYEILPLEIFNKRQNIIKKKWSENFNYDLQKIFKSKLKAELGEYLMDNPKTKDNLKSLGLFQESFAPVNVHADTGFDFNKIIFKQILLPLTPDGETVIFKNKFYGCSTTFSIDPKELKAEGYNKRSSEHLNLFKKKDFDQKVHKNYLAHEDLNNLSGLEVDMIYKWKPGEILIFDRTRLHCSSSNINKRKIGFTTATSKN